MKGQIQKNKTIDFMKLVNEGSIFQSSQLKLQQDAEDDATKGGKRKSNLMCFLQKIKEPTIQLMQKFLSQNKNQPHHIKNKITIYQDITIIYQFRKHLDQIRYDSAKMTQNICSKLQGKFNRAKITIKERIMKKLFHLNENDIIYTIRNKKEFVFNKSKKPIHIQPQSPTQTSLASKQQPQTRITQDQFFKMQAFETAKKGMKVQETQIQLKQEYIKDEPVRNEPTKIYKYGGKDLKEPIYIHAKVNPTSIKVIPYSLVNQLRKKHQFQENTTTIQQLNTPNSQKYDLFKAACQFLQDFNKFEKRQSLQKMKKAQILQFLEYSKQKATQILQNIKARKDAEQYRLVFQDVQRQLKTTIEQLNKQKSKQQQYQDVEDKAMNTPKKQESPDEQNPPIIDSSYLLQQRKLLFSVSNSYQALQLLGQKKHPPHKINWVQQEDKYLYEYAFDNQKFTTQIKCLLKARGQAAIIERIKFLSAPVKQNTFNNLHSMALDMKK